MAVLKAREDVRLVALDSNTGFTHAANVGAAECSGTYLVFLNPDIVVRPGAIAALADELDTHPEAWAATPWFVTPDGRPQHFWRRMPGGFVSAFCFTRWGKRVDRLIGSPFNRYRNHLDLPDPPGVVEILGVGAACLMVRRDEFEAAGRFDERYFNFFQDGEIMRAKHREGRQILGVGHAVVSHVGGETLKRLPEYEVEGQFLYALRQYLRGGSLRDRLVGGAAIRLDLLLPRPHRREIKERALRPLA